VAGNGFRLCALVCATPGQAEDVMREAKPYRQYAAECRRLAATMSGSNKETLLKMATVWDERADEAESADKTADRDVGKPRS
jgi:hypothetical protein